MGAHVPFGCLMSVFGSHVSAVTWTCWKLAGENGMDRVRCTAPLASGGITSSDSSVHCRLRALSK